MDQKHKCPGCGKEFDEIKQVVSNGGEPFSAVAYDWMRGLEAFGTYDLPKQVICHQDGWTHFRVLTDGEERLVQVLPYEPEKIQAVHEANEEKEAQCEHEGCESMDTSPYYMNQLETEPYAYYCDDHAYEEGFCVSCRQFLAGFESFDFSPGRHVGMCSGCFEQLRDEVGEFDEYDDDDWYEPDYYEDDYPFDFPDEPIPPEFDVVSGKSKVVIINGDVWQVDVTTYRDGHRESNRRQLQDTCYDGRIPF